MPPAPRVTVLGEAMWDLRAPRGASLARASSLELEPGGAAVLVAMRLARSGVPTAIASVLGDDALGHALRHRLDEAGVDTRDVRFAASRTPLLFAGAADDGSRELVGYRAGSDEVVEPTLRSPLVHLASLLPARSSQSQLTALALAARARGAFVSLDVNARPFVFRSVRIDRVPLFASVDWIKASHEDLSVLGFGEGLPAIAAMRTRMRPDATLVVTRGEGLVSLHGPHGVADRRVKPVRIVDAMGAGDAFVAGALRVFAMHSKRTRRSEDALLEAVDAGIEEARALLVARRRRS
jgi:sugar/nucleoside kinase (ribokinase family)